MKRLRLVPGSANDPSNDDRRQSKDANQSSSPLKFPGTFNADGRLESADRLFNLMDSMSRRIDDLARELNCFGHFDDDDDGPRAA